MTTKIINVIRRVHSLSIACACRSLCALWMWNCENGKRCTVFLNDSKRSPSLNLSRVPAASAMLLHSHTMENYLESIFITHSVRWIRIQVKLWMPRIVALYDFLYAAFGSCCYFRIHIMFPASFVSFIYTFFFRSFNYIIILLLILHWNSPRTLPIG